MIPSKEFYLQTLELKQTKTCIDYCICDKLQLFIVEKVSVDDNIL